VQITCDKCQTSYQVDDQLIPPEGAPVQCTKCQNLFTAFPPAAPVRAPARTVMMFAAEPVVAAGVPPSNPGVPPRTMTGPVPAAAPAPAPNPVAPQAPRAPSGQMPAAQPPFGSAPTQAFGIPVTPPSGRTHPAMPQSPAPAVPAGRVPSSVSQPVAPGRVPSSVSQPVAPAARPPAAGVTASSSNLSSIPDATLDQPLDLSRPGRMTQMFYSQGEATEQDHLQAARDVAGEAQRKPGQTAVFLQAADLEKQLQGRNRIAVTIILVLVIGGALAIAGALFGPAILGPAGADRQAQKDRDDALVLLRKDDVPDLTAADKTLGDILARKPLYVAAKADRALAQQFLADDRLWQAERLKASHDALGKLMRQLNARNDPNDAPQRAKDVDAMNSIDKQYEAIGKQAKAFEDQARTLIDEAEKADPKNPIVLRARAFITADHDQAEGAQKLAKQYLHEIGQGKDGWAELALAESDVSGKPSEEKRQEGLAHARAALALDPSLVRALYLELRLDTLNKKEAEAKADVSALTAANPAHTGGAALLAGLEEELNREKLDKQAREARVAAEAQKAAAAAAEAAEQEKKAAPKAKAAAKRNR